MKLAEENESIKIVDKYRRAAGMRGDYHYRGLGIQSRPGLHEYVAKRIVEYLRPGAAILELGAGSGAMSLRLLDLGFQVTAADFVGEGFTLHDRVPFKLVDLNTSFSQEFEGTFDGIVAIELIEHLENPRNFVRECRKILEPGGTLLITTPNVDNPVSKALFLREGSFMWFNDFNYQTDGHITPIMQWELDKLIYESKMNVASISSFGDPYESVRKSWKKLYIFAKLLEKIGHKTRPLMGEILVAVMTLPDLF